MDIWTALAKYSYFETERLLLRPLSYFDSEDFYEISNDFENLSFVFPACLSKNESDYLFSHSFLKSPLGIWAITEKSSQKMIGIIRLENLDCKKACSELGYVLNSAYRNQGFMTEAVKNIVFLAFKELGLKNLVIITHLENNASQQVAVKSGFKLVSQFKGSDRYTHQMKQYLKYQMKIGYHNE
ncbi:GNAT family N-acetyltransferase [Streptococcus parauberis]|uniref:Ribosomal-protein-L7/L12-serine acetyltransferase n=1 Tax=Streptococcus parauberis TaxID=1348 RepID=A0A854WME0_9STRE|nr:GNAT family N-acetyltransferase [Streptococcus parauberis]PCH12651.1 ribosomal-protein-L7/L12-serine acetyltransferase [Streptococcus parauberis]RFE02478.1 ribosomal-protein-L7/L12-serine acetyltransferase [Streptococcus parauberis]